MADDALFAIALVTPERILVDALATEAVLRTDEGDITFLAGHAPLVGTVEPGVVRVVGREGDVQRFATHGGFAQVEFGVDLGGEDAATPERGTRVTLLVGIAEPADEIDVERARAALEAAESRVAELTGAGARGSAESEEPDLELAEAEAGRRRAQVRLETVESGAATPAG